MHLRYMFLWCIHVCLQYVYMRLFMFNCICRVFTCVSAWVFSCVCNAFFSVFTCLFSVFAVHFFFFIYLNLCTLLHLRALPCGCNASKVCLGYVYKCLCLFKCICIVTGHMCLRVFLHVCLLVFTMRFQCFFVCFQCVCGALFGI